MAKLDKVIKLYKPGVEAVAVAGTKAELNMYKLQGWSEEKPKDTSQESGNQSSGNQQSATPSGGKKK